MSSDKYCCVPGCKDSGGMHAVLHGFPSPEKDRLRFNNWLYSIGSDILELENAHIFKYRRVCHKHFQDKYLCRNNRISNIAVPTLYLPGPNLASQSQPKLPCVGRKPLQELVNQPIPPTSTDMPITTAGADVNPQPSTSTAEPQQSSTSAAVPLPVPTPLLHTKASPAAVEVDVELLEILGEDPSQTKMCSMNIQSDLATCLQHISTTGLSKEEHTELLHEIFASSKLHFN